MPQSSPKVVALTKPDDPAKFKALVAKLNAKDSSGQRAVYREVDGWYALSDSQAAITQALEGNGPLADDPAFKEAMGKLRGRRAREGVRRRAAPERLRLASRRAEQQWVRLLVARARQAEVRRRLGERGGQRRCASSGASSGGPAGAGDFASELIGGVPGDAFAFLDFNGQGTTDQLEKLKSNPQAAAAHRAAAAEARRHASTSSLSLLSGEVAFYARQGVGIPELTLALAPKDPSAALATLDKLAAHLAAMSGGKVEPGTQGGHPVKTIDLGQFQIHYGSVDGKLLITSGVSGIADYGSGDHLADSADFKEAKDVAGMPDSTGGVVYVDLKDALPLLEGLASLSGQSLPSSTTENLRPLRSFLAWSNTSGETRTFDAFLEIK